MFGIFGLPDDFVSLLWFWVTSFEVDVLWGCVQQENNMDYVQATGQLVVTLSDT